MKYLSVLFVSLYHLKNLKLINLKFYYLLFAILKVKSYSISPQIFIQFLLQKFKLFYDLVNIILLRFSIKLLTSYDSNFRI